MKDKWFVRRLYDQTLDVYIDDGDVKVIDYMNCLYMKKSEHKKQMREVIEEAYDEGRSDGRMYGFDWVDPDPGYENKRQLFKKYNCE